MGRRRPGRAPTTSPSSISAGRFGETTRLLWGSGRPGSTSSPSVPKSLDVQRPEGVDMYAAVVTSFAEPPRYQTFDTPKPQGEHEVLADVLASGLHPRVRSGASGSHYTSTHELPLVPGIDGVCRLPDGRRAYFVGSDSRCGTMAEKAI